jgi:hypothetical protein
LWWVIALARVYEYTGNATYLAKAEEIYADLVGPWHAWATNCSGTGLVCRSVGHNQALCRAGGMVWYSKSTYRNAITNELFLTASIKLDAITHSKVPVANFTYLQVYYLKFAE